MPHGDIMPTACVTRVGALPVVGAKGRAVNVAERVERDELVRLITAETLQPGSTVIVPGSVLAEVVTAVREKLRTP